MALSLGDINKKNPARKPKKSTKARGKTLMPWQTVPSDSDGATGSSSSDPAKVSASPAIEENNHTQTTHNTESREPTVPTESTLTKQDTNRTQNSDTSTHKPHTEFSETLSTKQHTTHTQTPDKPATNHTQNIVEHHTNQTQKSDESEAVAFQESNSTQTHNKPHTNSVNHESRRTHKPHTISTQTDKSPGTEHKPPTAPHTIQTQTIENRPQTTNDPVTNVTPHHTQKPHTEIGPNHTQNTSFFEEKLRKLSGLKLRLFDFIYNHCIENTTTELTITYEALSHFSGIKTGSIKEITRRLDNKDGLISRISSKGGRGTTTTFGISPEVQALYTKIRQSRVTTHNYVIKPHTDTPKTAHKPHTELHTIAPSKEVKILNSTDLTSKTTHSFEASSIDLASVQQHGIYEKHLVDIQNQGLQISEIDLQTLIDKFSTYMEQPENKGSIRRPAGLFIRFVQRFCKGEDVLVEIESDEDRALKEYLERRMRKVEERRQLITKVFEFEFEAWSEDLSKDKQLELVPEQKFKLYQSPGWLADLRQYFKENIWPEIKMNIPGI